MACCFPTCAQGWYGVCGERRCLGTLGAPRGLAHLGGISFANLPLVCVGPEPRRRANRWTRPPGEGRRGHCFRGSLGIHQITGKCAIIDGVIRCCAGYCWKLLHVHVLVRLPSLHDNHACMVNWNKGALWGNCRQIHGKTSFHPVWGFLLCRNSLYRFWGVILLVLWIGRARHPGPRSLGVSVEVFNIGGWLTHGDFASEAGVVFLAVVEHGLIPARVRSEWARLRSKGLRSFWAPAWHETSHVGNAGVGVVSMKGAPTSMPTFATAQFQRFFDCGGAVRCLLLLGKGRFLNLVVLSGCHGADTDAEELAVTEQLFDAALAELAVVAGGSLCLLPGDFLTWSPPRSLA